jgi:biotin carboxyl carrier protein
MEAGTIGAWNFAEGDSFEAGAVLAEIETDKATMGFEAQDPGVIAKILVQPGVEVGYEWGYGEHLMLLLPPPTRKQLLWHYFCRI